MNATAAEAGGDEPVEHLGPGIHERTDVDPVALASRLGALLITSDEAVDELVARTDHAPVARSQLDALATLVSQAEAADRIAARARTHATTAVGEPPASVRGAWIMKRGRPPAGTRPNECELPVPTCLPRPRHWMRVGTRAQRHRAKATRSTMKSWQPTTPCSVRLRISSSAVTGAASSGSAPSVRSA